ncbi:unnamed protein product [Mycena citricolor]|uniref:Uncharacterized protein n=1 Tax=Mycena citricolor TaxID=2018698 RepID=A0AAD2K5M2_9AGAR|nr:unnamed protein product [Mycena citricolor]
MSLLGADPNELTALTELIKNDPTCVLDSAAPRVNATALAATKFIFDLSLGSENASSVYISKFLASLTPEEAPETRSQASKKRKRSTSPPKPAPLVFNPTPVASLYTDGLDDDQIWAQIDLRMKNVCDMLALALEGDVADEDEDDYEDGMNGDEQNGNEEFVDEELLEKMQALEDSGFDAMEVDGWEDEDEDEDDDNDGTEAESEEQSDGDNSDLGEDVASLRDPSSEDEEDAVLQRRLVPRRRGNKSELDDGFFDLAAFNAETEEAEARKVSRGRLHGDSSDEEDDEVDLFAPVDDAETFDDEDENNVGDLSTHERRLAELRAQISSLESENVGPKEWVVMGEAGARSRPQNSLLEEDLDYERVAKAVPVVTEDRVQELEDRIKARILEGRFDDVVRIRPMEDKPFLPGRYFELQDKKSSQSLAQIYEGDYVAAQTGSSADDRDGKLVKEHAELEELWEGISGKLDALCNAHYVPKQPKAAITAVANVSTTTVESALPTTKSANSMLAPEEIFAASSSDMRARSELTPAEKQALHQKQRKAKQKSRDALNKSVDKYAKLNKPRSVKKQKQAALESVVKSGKGVTVVGKPKLGKTKGRKT